MANDELTAEEVEQLQHAAYAAIYNSALLGVLLDTLPTAVGEDQENTGFTHNVLRSALQGAPGVLVEQFPVLRKVLWNRHYSKKIRNKLMLEEMKDSSVSMWHGVREAAPGAAIDDVLKDAMQLALARLQSVAEKVPQTTSEDQTPTVHIYTDGGCSGNPGPGGIGVVWINGESRRVREHTEPVGAHVTNSYTELFAVKRALELLDEDEAQSHIVVHTDSQYVYNMLAKRFRAKANSLLIKRILELMAGADVEILKVPGHEKVWANERADQLATQGVALQRAQGV